MQSKHFLNLFKLGATNEINWNIINEFIKVKKAKVVTSSCSIRSLLNGQNFPTPGSGITGDSISINKVIHPEIVSIKSPFFAVCRFEPKLMGDAPYRVFLYEFAIDDSKSKAKLIPYIKSFENIISQTEGDLITTPVGAFSKTELYPELAKWQGKWQLRLAGNPAVLKAISSTRSCIAYVEVAFSDEKGISLLNSK